MSDTLDLKEGSIEVSRTYLGQQTGKQDKITIRPFVTDTALVKVRYGRTINTGNYESVRVDVELSCPCYKEEIVSTYRQVKILAATLIEDECKGLVTDTGR